MDVTTASIIGSLCTSGAAVAAVVVNSVVTRHSLRVTTARDFAKMALEFRLRQVNELFGPLMLYKEQSTRLHHKVRHGKPDPDNWRLLDYAPAILEDPVDGPMVREILRIVHEMELLIISKGGLMRSGGIPASFKAFLHHAAIMRSAFAEGAHRLEFEAADYYPRQMDIDVEQAYNDLIRDRDLLMSKFSRLLEA